MESILTSIKKLIGIDESDTSFDTDVTFHINTALATLTRLGVGPEKGFSISDKKAVWSQLTQDKPALEAAKTYVYIKVKLVFDPPPSAAVLESFKETAKELEWRLNEVSESEEEKV